MRFERDIVPSSSLPLITRSSAKPSPQISSGPYSFRDVGLEEMRDNAQSPATLQTSWEGLPRACGSTSDVCVEIHLLDTSTLGTAETRPSMQSTTPKGEHLEDKIFRVRKMLYEQNPFYPTALWYDLLSGSTNNTMQMQL